MGYLSDSTNMKLFAAFAVFTAVMAQEYDDLGNKKNQVVDKGPRECGGSKATDNGDLKFKCRSRATKNTKRCKAFCPKGMSVQTTNGSSRKLRCVQEKKGGFKWVSKTTSNADGPESPLQSHRTPLFR